VQIVTGKHLEAAMAAYKDAADELRKWRRFVKSARWRNFPEVRAIFKDADPVDGYVVFDFRNNRYRLITVIHYVKTKAGKQTKGHVYIRSFLTHKEYGDPKKWDPYRSKKK
jgi:mRNA interferase HigB